MYEGWELDMPNLSISCKDSSDSSVSATEQCSSVSSSSSLQKVRVHVPKSKLVIGLANGWSGDGKFLLITPEDVGKFYESVLLLSQEPRGFAFWNIKDEGLIPSDPALSNNQPVWMAAGLNSFLRIR